MECKKCGNTLRSGENFCTICGYYNDREEAKKEEKKKLDVDFDDDDDDDFFSDPNKESKEEVVETEEFFPEENIEVEDLLPSFIGEDYEKMKEEPFNLYACLLNWLYCIYRKLYIEGILGLIITSAVIIFLRFYSLIYFIIQLPILGYFFNRYYLSFSRKKVEKIINNNKKLTRTALENLCKKKGRVNGIVTLFLYAIFLVGTIAGLVFIHPKLPTGIYAKKNAEYYSTCSEYLKTVYQDVLNNPQYVYIQEGVCYVQETTPSYYDVYLKGTASNHNVYFYYSTKSGRIVLEETTEDQIEYEVKEKEGTITSGEKALLERLREVEKRYNNIFNQAEAESKKKDRIEKHSFVFSKEEIVR